MMARDRIGLPAEQSETLAPGVRLIVTTTAHGERHRDMEIDVSIRVTLGDLHEITGLESEREIAAWLAEQRGDLAETFMPIASERAGEMMPEGALRHLAACDRESGRLPALASLFGVCSCGWHDGEDAAADALAARIRWHGETATALARNVVAACERGEIGRAEIQEHAVRAADHCAFDRSAVLDALSRMTIPAARPSGKAGAR